MEPRHHGISERRLIFLLGAVQFVNALDFMILMPLGPDLASALGIPVSHLGMVGGSYTAAAAVAGMAGALFLDRFDRRRALAVAMVGLVLATAAGALARGFGSLVGARLMAGACGGPAAALCLAILADMVPPERRGKATAAIMGAFSVASVIGVPAGLELARAGGWRTPLLAVAGLGALVAVSALALLPPMARHLERTGRPAAVRPMREFLTDRGVLLALGGTCTVFMASFLLIPNLSAFFQFNRGFPRERLGLLYMVGGIVTFAAMRWGGAVVDRRGPLSVATAATALFLADLAFGLLPAHSLLPVLVVFVGFMVGNAVRIVAFNTLASQVPPPAERARFMSSLSAVQHLSAAVGAVVSSALLTERADGALVGVPSMVVAAMVLVAVLPLLVALIVRLRRPPSAAADRDPRVRLGNISTAPVVVPVKDAAPHRASRRRLH